MTGYIQISSTEWLEIVGKTMPLEFFRLVCPMKELKIDVGIRECIEDWLRSNHYVVDNYILIHEGPIVGNRIKAFLVLLNDRKVFGFTIELQGK